MEGGIHIWNVKYTYIYMLRWLAWFWWGEEELVCSSSLDDDLVLEPFGKKVQQHFGDIIEQIIFHSSSKTIVCGMYKRCWVLYIHYSLVVDNTHTQCLGIGEPKYFVVLLLHLVHLDTILFPPTHSLTHTPFDSLLHFTIIPLRYIYTTNNNKNTQIYYSHHS